MLSPGVVYILESKNQFRDRQLTVLKDFPEMPAKYRHIIQALMLDLLSELTTEGHITSILEL